ncbi:hypothetical protein Egran_04047 [Elaphomyces granulatus]|uniref:t-SNARE coiled-coil homology domain-containing protein n=1 Tax=Elaphomyces granulatus TaxID=519963 RepID=A0A232LVI9_9EURO|nr:hypothetical protein Egran_04047 [Elaphomyces granulatus]
MGDAYEREQQNNALLSSLAHKTSALKSVTIDIYDNARNQESIDSTVCFASSLSRHHSRPTFHFHLVGRVSSGGRGKLISLSQSDVFSSLSTNIKGSASRLTRAARQGDKVAVLKVVGICIGAGVGAWVVLGWIF